MTAQPMTRVHEAIDRQIGVIAAAVKQGLAYRFEFFTAILGSLLTMTLVYFLWTAIYDSATSMEMSYQALITYVCLGQAFSFARPGQRYILVRIGAGIRSGNVLLDDRDHRFNRNIIMAVMPTIIICRQGDRCIADFRFTRQA